MQATSLRICILIKPQIVDHSNQILHAAQGEPVLSRLRDVLLHHGRPFRTRRHGHYLGAGDDAALPSDPAVFLVHPGIAGVGGADHRHARRRRLLPLDSRGLRRLLGISRRMVELVCVVFAGRGVCRAVHRLPGVLLPQDDVVGALPHLGGADRRADLGQRARYSDGGAGRDRARDFHFRAG